MTLCQHKAVALNFFFYHYLCFISVHDDITKPPREKIRDWSKHTYRICDISGANSLIKQALENKMVDKQFIVFYLFKSLNTNRIDTEN